MKLSRRSVLAGTAAGAVAALAGCGRGGGNGGDDNTLTIWTFKQSEVDALQAAGDAWGKQNDMSVDVSVYTPDDAYETKVTAAARSKSLPDIVSSHSQGQDWKWAQAGITIDLTDQLDGMQDSFLPGLLDTSAISQEKIDNSGSDPAKTLKDLAGGHMYSVPYMAGTPGVIFANKQILEDAGVDSSNPPATWEEWMEAIQKTKDYDNENGGLVTGLKEPNTGHYWIYRPMAYGYLGPDAFYGRQGRDQQPSWSSPESVRTLELYDQLTPLWTEGVLNLDIDQADQWFAQGKAAWDAGGTFTLASLTAFGMDADDVMVFSVPASTEGALDTITYQAVPLVAGSVTSSSTHQDEAVSFLKYLATEEAAEALGEGSNDLPAGVVPEAEIKDDLLSQLVELVTNSEGDGEPFNVNDFSADPPSGTDQSEILAKLTAQSIGPEEAASQLEADYQAAWEAVQ